jgi:hypothetical protein
VVEKYGYFEDNRWLSEWEMTTIKAVADWQQVDIPWKDFIQPAWEGDGSAGFDPGPAMGLTFAFNGAEGGEAIGKIWVDDICFLSK